ncbi:Dirigent protein 25 [Nymphaea thermarum]|nr:Dirigent protein 25 [Nymphaea thermarum]
MAQFKAASLSMLGFMALLALTLAPAICARTLLDEGPGPLAPLPSPLDAPTTPLADPPVVGPAVVPVTTPGGDHSLTFYMHDILGGTHPTARAVTGIVNNVAAAGMLAFAQPTDVFLGNGGVPLPNSNGQNVDTNGGTVQSFLTGLGGVTALQVGSAAGGQNQPFVNGGQLPLGATLEKLEFGTITVIDDQLTQGDELGSPVVGKAQGFYVASSEDGSSQTLAFTALLESGGFADSLSFFGVHRTAVSESYIAVIGGTGKYVNAKGHASIRTLPAVNTHETDGAQTVLQFEVYLSY